ncbi:sperm-specific H1/protamine-like protein type 2 [Hyalella azteca]|uniref:Sperm-specific H1/protamine-like protein type 2 n=1 Tax=Hyalella azteca TaxID=294128 RepID=A0A8B7N0A7_HYAAZ|nr:sperm-specific H1/protamine-like protein type 2 [Hyalella azteca]
MGRRDKAPVAEVAQEEEEAEEVSSAPESTEESEEEPATAAPPQKKAKTAKKAKASESEDEAGVKKQRKKARRSSEALNPPTTEMVLQALMALDEKKGTTIKAIKDYILLQNDVRPEHISHLMRKALPKLLAKESIIRPKGEENKSVMLGRYKIAPRKTDKTAVRERPASLRKLVDPNAPAKKKKKRKRSGFY